MSTLMRITDEEWTFDGMVDGWQQDEQTSDPEIAAVCADSQYAYLVNNASRLGVGWQFAGGGFEGPAYDGALSGCLSLITESIDAVVGWIANGEIFELADGE